MYFRVYTTDIGKEFVFGYTFSRLDAIRVGVGYKLTHNNVFIERLVDGKKWKLEINNAGRAVWRDIDSGKVSV